MGTKTFLVLNLKGTGKMAATIPQEFHDDIKYSFLFPQHFNTHKVEKKLTVNSLPGFQN